MSKGPAIDVVGYEKCVGCFACLNACPEGAVKVLESDEGFYYPKVCENCKKCGVCQEFCPVLSSRPSGDEPKFYAGWSKSEEIRIRASSGGIFPELAKYVLESGGIVFGVALDEKLSAKHVKVESVKDLDKLMGSKYVQSYVDLAYREALNEAKKRLVLFSGTPCQTAALRNFEGSENVIVVDVVCHGVSSNLAFRKYLKFVEREAGKRVVGLSFRDKKSGWKDYQVAIKLEDGTEIRKHHKLDPFFRGYLLNLYLRLSCYSCPFCKIPRSSDITLGDFWGVPRKIRDRRGVSIVIVNSKRGEKILNQLLELGRIELVEVSSKLAIRGNPRIISGEYAIPKERGLILKTLRGSGFEEIIRYLKPKSPLFKVKLMISSLLRKVLL